MIIKFPRPVGEAFPRAPAPNSQQYKDAHRFSEDLAQELQRQNPNQRVTYEIDTSTVSTQYTIKKAFTPRARPKFLAIIEITPEENPTVFVNALDPTAVTAFGAVLYSERYSLRNIETAGLLGQRDVSQDGGTIQFKSRTTRSIGDPISDDVAKTLNKILRGN